MNSKTKHSTALKNKKRRYDAYKNEGRLEKNKALRAEKVARGLAKAAARRERKAVA